jgi:hypothetical protein
LKRLALVTAAVIILALTGCAQEVSQPKDPDCPAAMRAADLAEKGDLAAASTEVGKVGAIDTIDLANSLAVLGVALSGDESTSISSGVEAVRDVCA